jgi:hypothetical protein
MRERLPRVWIVWIAVFAALIVYLWHGLEIAGQVALSWQAVWAIFGSTQTVLLFLLLLISLVATWPVLEPTLSKLGLLDKWQRKQALNELGNLVTRGDGIHANSLRVTNDEQYQGWKKQFWEWWLECNSVLSDRFGAAELACLTSLPQKDTKSLLTQLRYKAGPVPIHDAEAQPHTGFDISIDIFQLEVSMLDNYLDNLRDIIRRHSRPGG